MSKKSLEYEINEFLQEWDVDEMRDFFKLVEPLIELYDISEKEDWVEDEVGEEDVRNIRLIRTVYLISRISERFAGRFVGLNIKFKNFWKRLEKQDTVRIHKE